MLSLKVTNFKDGWLHICISDETKSVELVASDIYDMFYDTPTMLLIALNKLLKNEENRVKVFFEGETEEFFLILEKEENNLIIKVLHDLTTMFYIFPDNINFENYMFREDFKEIFTCKCTLLDFVTEFNNVFKYLYNKYDSYYYYDDEGNSIGIVWSNPFPNKEYNELQELIETLEYP